MEKKILGVFVSAHPLAMHSFDLKIFSHINIKDLNKKLASQTKEARKPLHLVALLSHYNKRRTKKER